MLGWAKEPNAALVAQDFIMSVKGQSAVVGATEKPPALFPNVTGLDVSKNQPDADRLGQGHAGGVKAFRRAGTPVRCPLGW